MQRIGRGSAAGEGRGRPEPQFPCLQSVRTCPALPHPLRTGKVWPPTPDPLIGPAGGGAGSGVQAGGAGRGGARGSRRGLGWRGDPRAGAARSACGCGARGSRADWDHMSGGAGDRPQPAGGLPAAAAPQARSPAPYPALTMSICCCFFFRDYGSSKRKSGKGASGHFSFQPPFPLGARASRILQRT